MAECAAEGLSERETLFFPRIRKIHKPPLDGRDSRSLKL